ncbi:ParB/RepB/Spo0J family partition protein [Leeia aquatica]|uniref:ParB/RepB/Spo0J family partition protein n=2 Tax=Leeia aquatica TaxID=2725557 RepID=A0A847RZQ9_9NEIS|nr:ParB/RepB/Spo0J family partition protein [Leeia aquatica]NLR76590.1 ParB/RepB/Spo0J family partition protein [Leeia aquatica]
MAKLKGLGRGLDALLGGDLDSSRDTLMTLPVSRLRPGKYQPRSHMDVAALDELAASIKAQGLIQPILVRAVSDTDYEIIAGERRWRASQLAGLTEVPVLVRDVPDEAALAIALIENIQRQELNALEEAQGLQRLIDEFGMTHDSAATAVGRSRSAVSNLLRLLQLSRPVQALLSEGGIDMGHARALLALPLPQQSAVAQSVADKGLSVRQTEALVKQVLNPPVKTEKKVDADVARLSEGLSDRLGARVEVRGGSKGRGKIVIEYLSLEQLDGLLERFGYSA